MDWNDIILGVLGTFLGGGCVWLFTFRATKRKANGEATQTEAEGWKAMQDVYQQTIKDLNECCEDIRKDRNLLREENNVLREENRKLREKYNDLEQQIMDLRKEMARQGRRLESVMPFACSVVSCTKRTRIELHDNDIENEH